MCLVRLSSSLLFSSELSKRGVARAALALSLLFALPSLGCNEAPLRAAPDAGTIPCTAPQLEVPCKVQDAGVPGCSPDLQSTASLGQEVTIAPGSYPVGCAVIVNAKVLDQDDQCTQLGSCDCGEDAGSFAWTCFQSH